jgi:hypothetical protein
MNPSDSGRTANRAVFFGEHWAKAVAANAKRIEAPDDPGERIADCFQQVIALRCVVQAADMAKTAVQSDEVKTQIQEAIKAFMNAVIVAPAKSDRKAALGLARNVIAHFESWYVSGGPKQRFIDFRGEAKAPVLEIHADKSNGRLLASVDLVTKSPTAARDLVDAMRKILTRAATQR